MELVKSILPLVKNDFSGVWKCCDPISPEPHRFGNPVNLAICSGKIEVVKLIEPYVNFEPKTCCMSLPLHLAACHESEENEIYDYLLKIVKNKEAIDEFGRTHEDIIERRL